MVSVNRLGQGFVWSIELKVEHVAIITATLEQVPRERVEECQETRTRPWSCSYTHTRSLGLHLVEFSSWRVRFSCVFQYVGLPGMFFTENPYQKRWK